MHFCYICYVYSTFKDLGDWIISMLAVAVPYSILLMKEVWAWSVIETLSSAEVSNRLNRIIWWYMYRKCLQNFQVILTYEKANLHDPLAISPSTSILLDI